MSNYKKIGTLKVPNGEYEKDGKTVKRWHEVGVVFATPHHSAMFVKMHPIAGGEGNVASIFYDEGCKPNFIDKIDKEF